MKRNKSILIVVIAVMLIVVSSLVIRSLKVNNREIILTSSISSDECMICNNEMEPNLGLWGENNLGVFHINDFQITPINILRYNVYGELEKGPFGTFNTWGVYSDSMKGNGGVYPDRKLMTGSIDLASCEKIDSSKVEKLFCQSCIDKMMDEVYKANEMYGIGFINLETKEVRLVEKSMTGFGLNDYYVCVIVGEDSRLHMNVIYCPVDS